MTGSALRRSFLRLLGLGPLLWALSGLIPGSAPAAVLPPFGVDLSQAPTPTLDTANGAVLVNGKPGPKPAVSPNPHDAADAAFYNTVLPQGSNVAPEGGQILKVMVKGCAVEDTTAPVQTSPGGDGKEYPVNTINLETLAPQSDGSYKVDQISAFHLLPFCASTGDPSATATPDTVTTFEPVHMCVNPGESVDFYDIGGFIPAQGGRGPWYPQGVPFRVLAPVRGATMQSFVFPAVQQFGPGYRTADPNPQTGGFAQESNQEVLLQVVMGTGDDAYGLCPGGHAEEPSNPASNTVICVFDRTPEPNAPAPPCAGYGPPVPTPAGSALTQASTSGHAPVVKVAAPPPPPGKPALGHAALNGVGNARAIFRFVVQAPHRGQPLDSLSVRLPSGLSFARRLAALRRGVTVTSQGSPVKARVKLQHGVLVIQPAAAAPRLEVKLTWPTLVVSRKLAVAAHRRRAGPARIVIEALAGLSTAHYGLNFQLWTLPALG